MTINFLLLSLVLSLIAPYNARRRIIQHFPSSLGKFIELQYLIFIKLKNLYLNKILRVTVFFWKKDLCKTLNMYINSNFLIICSFYFYYY